MTCLKVPGLILVMMTGGGCARTDGRRTAITGARPQVGLEGGAKSEEAELLRGKIRAGITRLAEETVSQKRTDFFRQGICQKAQELQGSCPLRALIRSGAAPSQISCQGTTSMAQTSALTELWVQISAQAGRYRLIFDNTYAATVEAGQQAILDPQLIGDGAGLLPNFLSLRLIEIELLEGASPQGMVRIWNANFPKILEASFDLSGKKRVALVDPGWSQLASSSQCALNLDQYNALLTEFTTQFESREEAVPKPVDLKFSPDSADLATLQRGDQLLQTWIGEQLRRAEQHENAIAALRDHLITAEGIGCWLQQPIEKLVIELEGNLAATHVVVSQEQSNKKKYEQYNAGDAGTLQVDFGSFSTRLTSQGSTLVQEDLSQFRIGSMTRIHLKKMGLEFKSVGFPCSSGIVSGSWNSAFGGNDCYEIRENHQMEIAVLRIVVNEIELYRHEFSPVLRLNSKTPESTSLALRSHPSWSAMLFRRDCDAVQ